MRIQRKALFVTNEAGTIVMDNLTANFRPAVRREVFEGRQHIVVPMVMLVEGVHAGSQGPLLYTNEEIKKTPGVWNHKPVVVRHPEQQGISVSACSPEMVKQFKVGLIFNAKFEGNKLKAEAWIDVEKLRKIDARILSNIEAGQITEISTGLFSDHDATEGEWNGEKYVAVVRNMRPDHLAILYDEKGACSVAKGAGLLRNEASEAGRKQSIMDRAKTISGLIANAKSPWTKEDEEFLLNVNDAQFEKIVANAKVEDDEDAKKVPLKKIKKADPVVNTEPKADDKKVMTNEEFIASAPPGMREMLGHGLQAYEQKKTTLVASIVANEKCSFSAEQLNGMDIDALEKIAALATPTVNAAPKPTYAGLADQFLAHNPVVANVQGLPNSSAVTEEPLEEPVFNFQNTKS